MDSTRQQKVNKLIMKELSAVFQKDGAWIFGNKVLVSVTDVRISPDLSIVRAHLSIFPIEHRAKVLEQTQSNQQKIRFELAARLKNQLRKMPELHFYVDDSFDKIERIEQLLKK
jgi:ribosome-binding factor A